MPIIQGNALGEAICTALGIEPRLVMNVKIESHTDDVAFIHLTVLIEPKLLAQVAEAFMGDD